MLPAAAPEIIGIGKADIKAPILKIPFEEGYPLLYGEISRMGPNAGCESDQLHGAVNIRFLHRNIVVLRYVQIGRLHAAANKQGYGGSQRQNRPLHIITGIDTLFIIKKICWARLGHLFAPE